MNILFINHSNIIGGAELSMVDLVKYLAQNNVKCYVAIKKCKKNLLGKKLELIPNTSVCYVKSISLIPNNRKTDVSFVNEIKSNLYNYLKSIQNFFSYLKILKTINAKNIDLIHTNTIYPTIGKKLAQKLKIPHIQHIRELVSVVGKINNFKYLNDELKFVQKYGTHSGIIANSTFCLKENLKFYNSRNQLVMYNSVSKDFFGNIPQTTTTKVGLVANVTSKWKRHDLFIGLAKKYKEKYNDSIQFVIYGSLPKDSSKYYTSLMDKIRNEKLLDFVKFSGSVPSFQIYNEIKILVHCCPEEPFGRIFVEAAAAGIPIVAIRGGGASEIVNTKMGFLFNHNQLEKMADKIKQLISSKSKFNNLSKTARIEAQQYLSENVYKNIIPFYKKIIHEKLSN